MAGTSVDRLFVSSQFKKCIKILTKKHDYDTLSKIEDIVHKLESFEVISGEHKNHKLGGAEGVQDIHISNDLILLYRYSSDESLLYIDLQLLNLTDHTELHDKSSPKFVKKQLLKQVNMPYNINENKKKKNVFGAFCTLNPDAGDVEKTIDIFNDSIADNIGSTAIAEDLELTEQLLTEGKIVTFDGETNPNNGWIVVMAGGSGSGKGFVFNTLVPFHGKKLDPDELKPYIIKTSEILGDEIVFKDGSRVNLLDAGIDPPYNLRNPEFVALIHTHPLTKRLKKQQKDMLFKSASTADERRLPNIIFDTTLDELSKLEAIVDTYKPLGYKIAVVYVFTPIDAAVNQNELRPRKVPKEILLDIHRGVYRTLPALLHDKELLSQINDIWVVQQYSIDINDKQSVVDYIRKNNVTKLPKNSDGLQYLEDEMSNFVETQLSRIAELEKEMHDNNIKAKSLEDADFGSNMDGGGMIESLLYEDDFEEDSDELTWQNVYNLFDDIVIEFFPDTDRIEKEIQMLCDEHKGEPAYDKAYERWSEWGVDESLEFIENMNDD